MDESSNGDANGGRARLPFRIEGAGGSAILVRYGDFYFNTKSRCRRMMLNSLSAEARQVYACLELATMGFQQEVAVVMDGGKKRLLTRCDIAEQTGLHEAHARRGLVELELAGLAERRPIEGGDLVKGNIEIYSWAEPHQAKEPKRDPRAAPIPGWMPDSWGALRAFVKRSRLKLLCNLGDARDSLMAEGEEVARDLEKAEKGARTFLERVSAQSRPNKEERTERTIERTSSSSILSTEEEGGRRRAPAGAVGDEPTAPETSPVDAASSPTGGAATGTAVAREPEPLAAQEPPPTVAGVLTALQKQGIPTQDRKAEDLIRKCQAHAPDCTQTEIDHFIAQIAAKPVGGQRPGIGWLLLNVPECFRGVSFRRYREDAKRAGKLDLPRLDAQAREFGIRGGYEGVVRAYREALVKHPEDVPVYLKNFPELKDEP
jgi:hypothetical protein